MNKFKKIIAIAFCSFCFHIASAKAISTTETDSLPTVFILGEYDGSPFEKMKANYGTTLLEICNTNFSAAYYTWAHLLKSIESYSHTNKFDLDGVKMWLYVFYNPDGSIGHLAYYLKPTSRNVKAEDMTKFLNNFAPTYRSPLKHTVGYSHYSNANFPVMIEKN